MWLADSPYPARPRVCDECGGELDLVFSKEPATCRFDFKEKYRCEENKGHSGYVKGSDDSDPRQWDYSGVVSR